MQLYIHYFYKLPHHNIKLHLDAYQDFQVQLPYYNKRQENQDLSLEHNHNTLLLPQIVKHLLM